MAGSAPVKRVHDIRAGDSSTKVNDETTPLFQAKCTESRSHDNLSRVEEGAALPDQHLASTKKNSQYMAIILPFLMLGVCISSIDTSILIAIYTTMGSEFNALSSSSWLMTSYMLGNCAVQPLYGKLSDIYGRKFILLIAYTYFTIGTLLCGVSRTMGQMIAGRVVSGIGAAGMTSLVSILITDMVPVRNVAFWRSFIYIAASIGRASGGPLGGILADTTGWHWAFILQVPLMLITLLLVWRTLKMPPKIMIKTVQSSYGTNGLPLPRENGIHPKNEMPSRMQKFGRIDFAGALSLGCATIAFLLLIDLGGGLKFPLNHPCIISAVAALVIGGAVFVLAEWKVAADPIFPLRLLSNRDIIVPYVISMMLSAAQLAMLSTVAIYFRVTAELDNLRAAIPIIPSNIAYIVGSFSTALIIRKTGRYKMLIVAATFSSMMCSVLMIWRWRGQTSFWESLFILPGGLSCGIGTAAIFVGLAAGVEKEGSMAVAASGFYLLDNLGVVSGISLAAGVLQGSLRILLPRYLEGIEGKQEIIHEVLGNIENIFSLSPDVKPLVVSSYVKALEYSHFVSLIASLIAFVFALFLREHKVH